MVVGGCERRAAALVVVLIAASLVTAWAAGTTAASAAALPDGRVYEQVTPSAKAGAEVLTGGPVSLDGQSLEVETFGTALPGSLSLGLDGYYVFTRGAGGWSYVPVQPLDPTVVFFDADALVGTSADLSRAVFSTENQPLTPGAPAGTNLFVVGTQDAADDVRLMTPAPLAGSGTPAFIAGDDDYDHALFSDTAALPVVNGAASAQTMGSTGNLYDYDGGQLYLASVEPNGSPFPDGIASSSSTGVSADGSDVFFIASLDGRVNDARLYDRRDDTTTIDVSAPDDVADPVGDPTCVTSGASANDQATLQGVSSDGSTVLFTSRCALTSAALAVSGRTDATPDLYAYDLGTGSLTDLSLAGANAADHGTADAQGVVGMSSDGSIVYFVADAQLVSAEGTDGDPNLYVDDHGAVTFLSTLSTSDAGDWSPFELDADVTPDGQTLLFESVQPLTAYDNNGVAEAYELSLTSPMPTCVSCDPSGDAPVGPVTLAQGSLAQRSDGTTLVFFQTPDPLVSADTNAASDVYEYEDGSDSLISSGTDPLGADLIGASPSGDDVYFQTTTSLVPADDDDYVNVYDARVNGGQTTGSPPSTCSGDACQGPLATPPSLPTPAAPLAPSSVSTVTVQPPPAGTRLALTVLAVSAATRRDLVRDGAASLSVRISAAGRVAAVAGATIGGRRRVIASASATGRRAGTLTLRLRLSVTARRALARGATLHVQVTFSAAGAAARSVTFVLERSS